MLLLTTRPCAHIIHRTVPLLSDGAAASTLIPQTPAEHSHASSEQQTMPTKPTANPHDLSKQTLIPASPQPRPIFPSSTPHLLTNPNQRHNHHTSISNRTQNPEPKPTQSTWAKAASHAVPIGPRGPDPVVSLRRIRRRVIRGRSLCSYNRLPLKARMLWAAGR